MAAFNWRFDWDPEKALGNLAKHGSCQQATTVLKDPLGSRDRKGSLEPLRTLELYQWHPQISEVGLNF